MATEDSGENSIRINTLSLIVGQSLIFCHQFSIDVTLAHLRALSGCDLKSGASAVPECGFANCVRAVRKPARPATTQVCQELAARVADGVTSVGAAMKRGTGLSRG